MPESVKGIIMNSTTPVQISELVKQAISNVIKLLIIFGILAWSGEQTAVVLLVVDSTLALFFAVWTVRRTTPTAAPVLPPGAEVTIQGTPDKVTIPNGNGGWGVDGAG